MREEKYIFSLQNKVLSNLVSLSVLFVILFMFINSGCQPQAVQNTINSQIGYHISKY